MKVRLCVVGRPRDRELRELHERYASRIRRFGVDYEPVAVRPLRSQGRYSDEHVRQRESEALLERWDGRGSLIALDSRGTLWSSEQVAARLETWATPCLWLLVGGPLGLHERALGTAHERWSLSPLTFPHELVPVLVAEQLYRALAQLRGAPYHKA